MYPRKDDNKQESDEHMWFFHLVLSVYGKHMNDVVDLISDKESMNQLIGLRLIIPLLGCDIQIFQLNINKYFKQCYSTIMS